MELFQHTANQLHKMLINKEVTCEEIIQSVLNRVEKVDENICSYITVTRDSALEKAREIDKKIINGDEIPPLTGIPVAVKDNMCTENIRTTCSSNILHNYIPPYNATVVERLNDNNAVMIGKTNMDEFAMGSSCENSGFFSTRNPWAQERVPGGSSGGSAAAVAADEAVLGLGSDTGGSVRLPAAFCGIVGMKPTYGAVSRYGLIAFASSLDQIGPFAKDVSDCAWLLSAICGYDPKDSTSVEYNVPDYTTFLNNNVKGFKIGIPKEFMGEGIDEKIKKAIEDSAEKMASLGAEVEETSLPHSEYALAAYYLIAPAEASSNLARYDGVRYGYRAEDVQDVVDMFKKTRSQGFGPEVKRRIMLGTYALSAGYYDAYYNKALKVRTLIKQDFDKAFEKYDLLMSPTNPVLPFRRGEKIDDPLQMYLVDLCTQSVNLAGIPAISLPAGLVEGLPVGLQLMGKPFDEGNILQAAYTFEQNTGYYKNKPSM
ncbi:MAG: Asp-tRNA(Asn)/Glu-tRNA(Gln) amidotransferase subunit GatA [Clostridiales bacterium]|nr:Asp-tRNA(Asn)/Glu-tRNA(Gln) amidotransferase subunit GatA [Clostridiales bacterium]MCF8021669.1 Asp-tRNA(Asn)/Glu-tRNA(Gln) amidotransferase subunit GatA [Clostridiales bacterium]